MMKAKRLHRCNVVVKGAYNCTRHQHITEGVIRQRSIRVHVENMTLICYISINAHTDICERFDIRHGIGSMSQALAQLSCALGEVA